MPAGWQRGRCVCRRKSRASRGLCQDAHHHLTRAILTLSPSRLRSIVPVNDRPRNRANGNTFPGGTENPGCQQARLTLRRIVVLADLPRRGNAVAAHLSHMDQFVREGPVIGAASKRDKIPDRHRACCVVACQRLGLRPARCASP
jgi:hypothetical protein